MNKLSLLIVGSSIFLGTAIAPAEAASITVANSGFEEPSLIGEEPIIGEEVFTFETPPGWQLYDPNKLIPAETSLSTSYPGVWNPSSIFFSNEAPEGENIGAIFLNQVPGSGVVGLTQTLTETLQADTEYTLQVEVGNPGTDFFAGFPGYGVQLLAGDTIVAEDDNTLEIAEASFSTSTISFTASADNPNLEQSLQIRLLNTLDDVGSEVNFDDVRLFATSTTESTAVPESVSIWGLLLLGISLFLSKWCWFK